MQRHPWLLSLATALVTSSSSLLPAACMGGCYAGGEVTDLTVTPTQACLAIAASPIDPCRGDYGINIDNHCTVDLMLEGASAAPGGFLALQTHNDDSGRCIDDVCQVNGTLGGTPISIRWVVVDK